MTWRKVKQCYKWILFYFCVLQLSVFIAKFVGLIKIWKYEKIFVIFYVHDLRYFGMVANAGNKAHRY